MAWKDISSLSTTEFFQSDYSGYVRVYNGSNLIKEINFTFVPVTAASVSGNLFTFANTSYVKIFNELQSYIIPGYKWENNKGDYIIIPPTAVRFSVWQSGSDYYMSFVSSSNSSIAIDSCSVTGYSAQTLNKITLTSMSLGLYPIRWYQSSSDPRSNGGLLCYNYRRFALAFNNTTGYNITGNTYYDTDTGEVVKEVATSSGGNYGNTGLLAFFIHAVTVTIIKYAITHVITGDGTVTSLSTGKKGDNIIVTHTPATGYITNLANTTVKDASGNNITYTLLTPTSFQFTMPASDVTINVEFKSNDPYSPGGDSAPSTPGGDGEFNNNSDAIPVPVNPSINYSDSGLVRLFSPSVQQVIDFGNYLWSGLIDLDTIIKAFQDPMQNIISFHMVPIAVDKGTSIAVKFAGISTGVNMYPVTKQIYDISMGSLQFPKYYGSSLDYSPYTQAVLYLPYIGEIPLDVDECIGKTLTISYKIDVFSGNCVAFVAIDGNVFYMKSGNMLQTIPISQSSFSQIVGTATGLLASALGGAAVIGGGIGALGTGTALGGMGNLISQSASIASQAVKPASDLLSVIAGKPQPGHTSLGGGITGYLSIQYPYVNIKRVKESRASSFASEYGYPLNVTGNLKDYTGFVKVSDIVFNGMTSTDAETGEIYNLLRSGIVIYGNTLPSYTAPANGLKIALEYYTGVPNSPDKAITTKAEIIGTFRTNTDLTRPTIYVEGYLNTLLNESNMVCVPEFKRRYYIKEIRVITANSYEIDLICDVLTSFWNEFKSSLCIIERAQSSYNLMIRDNLFVGQQDRLIQQLKFPNSFSTQSYILALTGNNGTGT